MKRASRSIMNVLNFLGDAILDAIVGDIVYRHFEGKREGFLTNTR
jgi:ribonuclease-3